MNPSSILQIVLQLKDEASAAMQSAASSMMETGKSMASAGATLSMNLTAPIVALAGVTSKAAMDYQGAAEQLMTQAGYTQAQTDQLTQSVLDFAASGKAQQDVYTLMHEGLYNIASLGVPAADAMHVLQVASTGAAIGHASLESVSKALGAAIASNIKGSSDYGDTMATLNGIVGAGDMRMQDLADALGNVLPQATTAGLSITDVGAAMATMTDNGMPATDAATRLHMAIALMSAPTKQATDALATIGMSQFQLADDMRNKGILPALTDLHNALVNSGKSLDEQSDVLNKAFGGGRSAGAIELLLNNLGRVGDKVTAISAGIADYQEKVIAQGQTAGATFAEMQSSISASSVELGNALMPLEAHILPMLASGIHDVVQAFISIPKPVQEGVVVFLGLLATLGPILFFVGKLVETVGVLGSVFIGTASKAALLAPVYEAVSAALGGLVSIVGGALTAIAAFAGISVGWLLVIAAAVGVLAYLFVTHFTQIKAFVVTVASDIATFVKTEWGKLCADVTAILAALGGAISFSWQKIQEAAGVAWNGIVSLFKAVGTALYVVVTTFIDLIVGTVVIGLNTLFPGWQKGLRALLDFFTQTFDAIGAAMAKWFGLALSAVTTALNAIGGAWNVAVQALLDFLKKVFDAMKVYVDGVLTYISGAINTMLTIVSGAWNTVWGGVSSFFLGVWKGIQDGLSGAINYIVGLLNSLLSTVSSISNQIMAPIAAVTSAVTGALAKAGSMVSGAVGTAVGVGSSITHFASGGIVDGPTFALVGEAGPEAIIPLSLLGGKGGGGMGAGSGGGNVVVNLNGDLYTDAQTATKFGNAIAKIINQQLKLRTF